MKNHTYYLIVLLFFIAAQLNAQIKLEDRVIVYHHDGSVYIGELVSENARELVMILSTTDTILVNKSSARKIKRTPEDILLHQKGKYHYTKGFFATLTQGFGLSSNFSQQTDLILGMRLDKKFSVGLGIGLHSHATVFSGSNGNNFQSFNNWNWIQNNFVPIYAYGRYYPWDFRVRPFADVKLGYGFPNLSIWGDNHSGGVNIQSGIGVHFASRRNFRWTLALSQSLQHTKGGRISFDTFSNEVQYSYKIWYNRTMLTLGLEFR